MALWRSDKTIRIELKSIDGGDDGRKGCDIVAEEMSVSFVDHGVLGEVDKRLYVFVREGSIWDVRR